MIDKLRVCVNWRKTELASYLFTMHVLPYAKKDLHHNFKHVAIDLSNR